MKVKLTSLPYEMRKFTPSLTPLKLNKEIHLMNRRRMISKIITSTLQENEPLARSYLVLRPSFEAAFPGRGE